VAIKCSKMGAILSIVGRDYNRIQETLHQLEGINNFNDLTRSVQVMAW